MIFALALAALLAAPAAPAAGPAARGAPASKRAAAGAPARARHGPVPADEEGLFPPIEPFREGMLKVSDPHTSGGSLGMPRSRLVLVEDAGHSGWAPPVRKALQEAIASFEGAR